MAEIGYNGLKAGDGSKRKIAVGAGLRRRKDNRRMNDGYNKREK